MIDAAMINITGLSVDITTLAIGSIIIFVLLAMNGAVNYIEGMVLLIVYFIYILFLIESKEIIKKKFHFREFVEYSIRFEFIETLLNFSKSSSIKEKANRDGLVKDFIISAISLAALIYGARLLVDNSIYFSMMLGVSETFTGLALIAVGTSLPELAVSISAVRKGFNEILIGNIIGSSIANISLVFGITSFIAPVQISDSSIYYLIPAMLIFSVLFLALIRKGNINRKYGAILLTIYALFLLFAGFRNI